MTRRAVLREMDSQEISGWVAYDKVHVSRTDMLLAHLCSFVFNAVRAEGVPGRSPDDFLGRPRPKHDPWRVARKLLGWARVRGASPRKPRA